MSDEEDHNHHTMATVLGIVVVWTLAIQGEGAKEALFPPFF